MSEHDPFNDPELAHARARDLMPEPFFWDCVNELAPFDSDEGSDAYYEWRQWRIDHPALSLTECISWIMSGQLAGYNESLHTDECIENDLSKPDDAFLAEHYDMFTMDATVIATALGQLLDEGTIDSDAKQYVHVAINRQLHPRVCMDEEHREILLATKRVLYSA